MNMKQHNLMLAACLFYLSICPESLLAGWTRNTTRDHKLAEFDPPRVDLGRYKSVQTRPEQAEDLAVAVAISGGGHRAANFAAGVLLALEDYSIGSNPQTNLLNEVDYFSTVSGGGFPVSLYLATRHDHSGEEPYIFQTALLDHEQRYLKNLRKDYQVTLLEAGVTPKCIGFQDAGDLLERKFDDYLVGAKYRSGGKSLTLNDLFRSSGSVKEVNLPYWFANATVYENGSRFVFTPGLIRDYDIVSCTHRLQQMDLSEDAGEMPLAVGLKTSASFPVLIPATTFTCSEESDPHNSYLHLLDGGLVDNQGIFTAFEVLRQDTAKRKVLIIIDAYKGVSQPRSRWRASPSGPEMAVRIMKIALDSARNRLEEIIAYQQQLARADGEGTQIEVVLLSFSTLKPETVTLIEDLENDSEELRKRKVQGFLRRMRREVQSIVNRKEFAEEPLEEDSGMALYDDARAVGTTLYITEAQQKLLLRAGREVVEQQRGFLSRILNP